jgi:transcriptional regulator with XRE-family HTH domain
LAQIRTAHGWSYQQLARLIAARARAGGVGMAAERQKIWRWEHRSVTPDRFTQRCLADVLGVPHDHLTTHRWPAWLPTAEPSACQQEIAELRQQLAEAREQVAALSRPPGQRVVCRTAARRPRGQG